MSRSKSTNYNQGYQQQNNRKQYDDPSLSDLNEILSSLGFSVFGRIPLIGGWLLAMSALGVVVMALHGISGKACSGVTLNLFNPFSVALNGGCWINRLADMADPSYLEGGLQIGQPYQPTGIAEGETPSVLESPGGE